MNKVLILESSKSVRKSIIELFEAEGFKVADAESVDQAERCVVEALGERSPFDLLFVNASLYPDIEGAVASLPFVVHSCTPSIDEALEMARRGALDYLCRPFDLNRLFSSIRQAMASIDSSTNNETKRPTHRRGGSCRSISNFGGEIVGVSKEVESLRVLIDRIAPSDARIMILGENGTGKELVAQCIHNKSRRSSGPFVEVNCAAIPSELIESELFGHEKGAFTSAIKQRRGKFEQASGGTLFLDEIGDMSLAAQAKVLRALQERKICRVGSDRDIPVDVRIIAATNKDLRSEIEAGNFREDLYHRIGVIVVRVIALRDRTDDIPPLVDHFLHTICEEYDINCKEISKEAISLLKEMRWSGNIRELRNVVERLVILSDKSIEAKDVKEHCV